jgi:hypothetical protein
MGYTVIEKGRHKCEKPAIPSWHGLRRGAVIECVGCGQRWLLAFVVLDAFTVWRKAVFA